MAKRKQCTLALCLRSTNLGLVQFYWDKPLQICLPCLCQCFNRRVLIVDDEGDTCGLAKSRSRREKREKSGRKSALDQLKKAKKGEKIKYEVSNLVYIHNSDSHYTIIS